MTTLRKTNQMPIARRFRVGVAFLVFAVLAVALTAPLALHLTTGLLGDPNGDTGIYIWNLWIFRHELIDHGHLPFSTDHIFAFTGGADFSLHNYTPIAGLIAIPLVPLAGIIGAFNLVLMLALVTSGLGAYALARRCGLPSGPAIISGALFMSMPLVSARETAHLSLVTNAALPLFVVALLRAIDRPLMGRGAVVGMLVALATYCDAYYGVFCILMGLFLVGWTFVRLRRTPAPRYGTYWVLDAVVVALGCVAAAAVLSGLDEIWIAGQYIHGLQRPYSIVAAATVLAVLRAWLTFRPTCMVEGADRLRRLVPAGAVAIGVCLVAMLPVLAGLLDRWLTGRLPDTPVFWRSTPRGVDLLAYLVPNPVHAVLGRWTGRWLLPPVQDAFPELIASSSLVLLAVLIFSHRRRRLPTMWLAFTGTFAVLSLGPFIHVGGVNTFVIGPWALLRYLPVIGLARSPSRFAIVTALGLSILGGFAADAWLAHRLRRSMLAVALACVLIAIEVIPGWRPIHSADVPEVYSTIAADRDERQHVLVLPAGVRDGTSSLGDFNASVAYFQTAHGHPLIGGYLSRVSDWRRTENMRMPMLRALYAYSAGAPSIDPDLRTRAIAARDRFLARGCIGYVVIDRRRASDALRTFAMDALKLSLIHSDDRFDLLTPVNPPACDMVRRPGVARSAWFTRNTRATRR
jgi:hypothetical protein